MLVMCSSEDKKTRGEEEGLKGGEPKSGIAPPTESRLRPSPTRARGLQWATVGNRNTYQQTGHFLA